MTASSRFSIRIFDDYHAIEDTRTCKAVELGCFPNKEGWCRNYFALFYNKNDPCPTFETIKEALFSKINFNKVTHAGSGKDISITQEEVEAEVRTVLVKEHKVEKVRLRKKM